MTSKFTKTIAIIFLVLAAALAFLWARERFDVYKNKKKDKNISVNLSRFSPEKTSKIVIKDGDKERNLVFRDNKWFVGEAEADEEKIKQLFTDMAELQIKEMVSENEENHNKFGVGKDNGLQLKITQDKKEETFYVGKEGAAPGDFYIRKEGVKNVYLVSGSLLEKLRWESEKWEKKNENQKTEEKK